MIRKKVKVLRDVIKHVAHADVFCSALQFFLWCWVLCLEWRKSLSHCQGGFWIVRCRERGEWKRKDACRVWDREIKTAVKLLCWRLSADNSHKGCSQYHYAVDGHLLLVIRKVMETDLRSYGLRRPRDDCYGSPSVDEGYEHYTTCFSRGTNT